MADGSQTRVRGTRWESANSSTEHAYFKVSYATMFQFLLISRQSLSFRVAQGGWFSFKLVQTRQYRQFYINICAHDSLVGLATGYRLYCLRSILVRGKGLRLYSSASGPALGRTHPPIQWVPGVKRPDREAHHAPPSNTEVNNGGGIPPLPIRRV
jgi:hypothetical protein